jgi:hypothetical protein
VLQHHKQFPCTAASQIVTFTAASQMLPCAAASQIVTLHYSIKKCYLVLQHTNKKDSNSVP